jgi:hypothetical protein
MKAHTEDNASAAIAAVHSTKPISARVRSPKDPLAGSALGVFPLQPDQKADGERQAKAVRDLQLSSPPFYSRTRVICSV